MLAPAKINLTLHVTGKRDDGYHILDSLVTFADYGDTLYIRPSNHFSFEATGNFAKNLPEDDSENLSVKAAHSLAKALNKDLNLTIHLTKNIPLGAGLGGGSADAAATIKALLQFWKADIDQAILDILLLELGADTPVCYAGQTSHVTGIGETIISAPTLPETPAILVYPNAFSSTAEIFKNYQESFSAPAPLPKTFDDQKEFYNFLKDQKNDLTSVAIEHIPKVQTTLAIIEEQDGCALSRMSGSGSTCFGLFDTKENSELAVKAIKDQNPDWWVQPAIIG